MVLHSTKGLLTLSSGAFKASDNTYLAKSTNLNNQFVSSLNIALNAVGKISSYYYSFVEVGTNQWLGLINSGRYGMLNNSICYYYWDTIKLENQPCGGIIYGNYYYDFSVFVAQYVGGFYQIRKFYIIY